MSHSKSTSPRPSLTSDIALTLTYIKSEIMIAPVSLDVKADAVVLLNQSIYDKPVSSQPGAATEQWINLDEFRTKLVPLLGQQYVEQLFVGLVGLPDSPSIGFGGTTVKGKSGWLTQQRAKNRRSEAMDERRREAAADLGGVASVLHSKHPVKNIARSVKRGASSLREEARGTSADGMRSVANDSNSALLDCLKEQPVVEDKVALRTKLSGLVGKILGRKPVEAEKVSAVETDETPAE